MVTMNNALLEKLQILREFENILLQLFNLPKLEESICGENETFYPSYPEDSESLEKSLTGNVK